MIFFWRERLSLEVRLNLCIALIMIFMTGVGFFWAIQDARKSVRQEAQASVSLALALIDAMPAFSEHQFDAIEGWIKRIAHLERFRHLSISVTSMTMKSLPAGAASAMIVNSQVPQWFKWWVTTDPIIIVRQIRVSPLETVDIHIESSAEDEINEAWHEASGVLGLFLLMAMAIPLSVHLIAGRALRPVGGIVKGLAEIEDGFYEARLPAFGLPELDRISRGINHLAAKLARVRNENRALTRHLLSIQEDERRSIAQEIHDEFGQNLTAIKMMTGVMMESPSAAVKVSGEIRHVCDRLFTVVRALMRRLRPMILEDLGLHAALEELVAHWNRGVPTMHVHLQIHDDVKEPRADLGLEVYRIIQEALTNAIRHSGATDVFVSLNPNDGGGICLVVVDNGKGIKAPEIRKGFGLIGMRERVTSLKGRFELLEGKGKGLEIRIVLPGERDSDVE